LLHWLCWLSSYAIGSFKELPTAPPLRLQGANNLNNDPLFIGTGNVISTDENGINT
jgi:hypothetical protein